MKKILLLIFSFLVFACNNNNKIINGELYFKLVNPLPNSGLAPQQVEEIQNSLSKLDSKNNSKLLQYFKTLKENNLLSYPYIRIKINDNKIIEIFLKQGECKKLKNYTLDNLNKQGKKIIISLKVKQINDSIFFSDKIINIKEVNGNSPWSK